LSAYGRSVLATVTGSIASPGPTPSPHPSISVASKEKATKQSIPHWKTTIVGTASAAIEAPPVVSDSAASPVAPEPAIAVSATSAAPSQPADNSPHESRVKRATKNLRHFLHIHGNKAE